MRSSLRVSALLLVGIVGLALADTHLVVAGDAAPLAGIVVVIDPGHNGDNDHHLEEISRPIWIGTRWKPCNQVERPPAMAIRSTGSTGRSHGGCSSGSRPLERRFT